MTWRILGPLVGAVAIVGVAIALLAPSNGTAIDPVAQAADTTAQAGSAEFGLAGSISTAGQTIPINGSGAIDMKSNAMRMSMSFPVANFGTLQMEELLSGTTVYVKFPDQLAARLPGGKAWMKMDLEKLGKSQGIDFKQALQSNQNNPSDMLQALKSVGNSHVVGNEDIGGDPTTHYAATIDLSAAADKIPDSQTADQLKQLEAQSGLSSMPVDVWIDRSGRVRRESVKLSSNQFSMDMTIEYTKFGATVDTTPPPDDQVLDASSLLGALGGSS
jgi:hypothetical protein